MGQDTRKDPRAKVLSLNVRYKSATVDEFIEHHSHDISKGGIFIKTPSPFPAGTLLKFEIRIREDQPLIAGVGRVVWKREPPQAASERPAGMGVKFIKLDGHSRELIDRIVAERKDDGPAFEETADGNAPSSLVPPPASSPIANTVSGSGGGAFFPAGPAPELPPPAERTVIKQTDEILAEALAGAGLGLSASAPVAPPAVDLPPPPAPKPGGAPMRKATLVGMPAAPFQLPPEVAAAAKELEAKLKEPEPAPVVKAPEPAKEPEPAPVVKAPEPVKEPSPKPAPVVAKAAEKPAKVEKTEKPAAKPAEKPVVAAAAAAPVAEQKGGAAGWLVVLLLVGAAGVGAYFLMNKGGEQPKPTPAPSAAASPTPAPTPSPVISAAPSVSAVPSATASEAPSASAAPSVSASAAPSVSVAAPATTTAAPPPPPSGDHDRAAAAPSPATTTAAPKPPPPPPPATTAAPKPPAPKPPADDNPYQ